LLAIVIDVQPMAVFANGTTKRLITLSDGKTDFTVTLWGSDAAYEFDVAAKPSVLFFTWYLTTPWQGVRSFSLT